VPCTSGQPTARCSKIDLAIFASSAAVLAASRRRKATKAAVSRAAQEAAPLEEPSFDPSVQIGAIAPLGYFDPAGFCSKANEDTFKYYRAAEMKHGRVAMLASIGLLAQHSVRFDGYGELPSGIGALFAAPATYGTAALVVLCGVLELQVWAQNPNDEPGNFGDPLGLGMYDDEMRNRELANGRFAMIAVAGIIAAEAASGQDAIQQLSSLQF